MTVERVLRDPGDIRRGRTRRETVASSDVLTTGTIGVTLKSAEVAGAETEGHRLALSLIIQRRGTVASSEQSLMTVEATSGATTMTRLVTKVEAPGVIVITIEMTVAAMTEMDMIAAMTEAQTAIEATIVVVIEIGDLDAVVTEEVIALSSTHGLKPAVTQIFEVGEAGLGATATKEAVAEVVVVGAIGVASEALEVTGEETILLSSPMKSL